MNTITLSAGLLTIPLSVYTTVEATAVTRREFLGGNPDVPVGRVSVRRDTGEVVDSLDVTRMAQATDGTWVTLDDAEVAAAVGGAGGCDVVAFVPNADRDEYLTDGLYQLRPKQDKRGNQAAVQAFGLLVAGMRRRDVCALVRVTMRGAPRYGLLSADGDLRMIVTADAIRQPLDLPDTNPSEAEVDMAVSLIEAIGVGAPVVVDDAAPKVQAYVDDKAASGAGAAPADGVTRAAPVMIDLVGLLSESINAAKAEKAAAAKPKRTRKVAA
jgi:non-homologous end joining protein Ku